METKKTKTTIQIGKNKWHEKLIDSFHHFTILENQKGEAMILTAWEYEKLKSMSK